MSVQHSWACVAFLLKLCVTFCMQLCFGLHIWAMSLPMGWASLFDMLCFSIEALCYILHAVVFLIAHLAMSLPMDWATLLGL